MSISLSSIRYTSVSVDNQEGCLSIQIMKKELEK